MKYGSYILGCSFCLLVIAVSLLASAGADTEKYGHVNDEMIARYVIGAIFFLMAILIQFPKFTPSWFRPFG